MANCGREPTLPPEKVRSLTLEGHIFPLVFPLAPWEYVDVQRGRGRNSVSYICTSQHEVLTSFEELGISNKLHN
jgi:hypothetical protein